MEQRDDGESGEVRPERVEPDPVHGEPVEPGAGELAPTELDAEQWRQFEQFRQFQQFQRFQQLQHTRQQPGQQMQPVPQAHPAPPPQPGYGGAGTGPGGVGTQPALPGSPPAPPRRRVPGWLRWLGKKVLAWLIFFLLLGIFATWLFNQLFGSDDDGNSTEAAARMGGGTYHTEELLAQEPYEAVRKVYDAIAQERPRTGRPLVAQACGHFDQDNGIQQRFARNTGGHADCRQAVLALHEQVTHVNDYAESIFPRWYDPSATSVRIDSCDFDIEGGPALGVFTVTQVEMGQWLITDHERGPRTCPSETGSSTESATTAPTDTPPPGESGPTR